MSFLDHPESHSCVESRSRHEIFVFGFDYTQKIGVQEWRAPPPPPFTVRPADFGARVEVVLVVDFSTR